MKNKMGFTIIELIAVIIIIGVIAGLVVLSVSKIIDINNEKAMDVAVSEILSVVEYEVIENNLDPLRLNRLSVRDLFNNHLDLNYSPNNYQSIIFYCDECESSQNNCPSIENSCVSYGVTVTGKNDWEGYVISGTKDNLSFE